MRSDGSLTGWAREPAGGRWVAGAGPLPEGAHVRLFCFAHAGGGAAFFRPWREGLAPDVDVRPVLTPGRESRVRELPCTRIEQLLEPLCSALGPYLGPPYALFGHSMGAIVAFEVARRLAAGGATAPVAVLVSGRRAPRLPGRRPRLSGLPDGQFLAAIRSMGGTPPSVLEQPQLVDMLLPALRSDFELNERYERLEGPRLDCPVVAYMGADDPEVAPDELLAWREETFAEFTLRVFGGHHFYLKGGPPPVLSAVRHDLARLVGASAQK